jgi:hypothetical protein
MVFADTPQTFEVENQIDYGTKRGTEIYNQGCAPLDDKSLIDSFNMTPDQTVIFIEALQRHCTKMGWNTGTKNITSFCNKDNITVDIIDEAALRTACEHFCSPAGADSRSRAKQHNTMMSISPCKITHS